MAGWESAPLVEDEAAPTAAWQSAPLADEAPTLNIDFSRPIPDVRAEIARLPQEQRQAALRQWADTYVANERAQRRVNGESLPGIGRAIAAIANGGGGDFVRNIARGTLVGSYLDEANAATSAALHNVTGGRAGAPYDEAIEYQRATDRAIDRENPVASTATQLAGGFASGAPIARAVMSGAATVPSMIARGVPVGLTAGYVSGLGHGEGTFSERQDTAIPASLIGGGLGVAAPATIAAGSRVGSAIHDFASPTLARWGTDLNQVLRRIGISASADGAIPDAPGARAAAEAVIANQLARSGRTVDDLRGMLTEADRVRRFNSNSYAQNALAPADLDPALQRLAGSAGRQSPEAFGIAQTFIGTRQTGRTPTGRALEPDAGLPHRPAFSREVVGEEPMGQSERVMDGLRRALRIEDEAHHGHQRNAYRTQQVMERSLKTEANKLYPAAWSNAEDFDIAPAFESLRRTAAQINDPALHGVFRRVEKLFSRPDGNGAPLGLASELQRFDLAKQRLDGLIDRFKGRDSFVYRSLTQFKNDLLDAVHGGDRSAPARNAAYAEARNFYFTEKQKQEAMDLGRAMFRGDADAGVDAYRALENDALRKFARLGLFSEAEKAARSMKTGADRTALFDNPRMEALLSQIIPRTETATGRVKIVNGQPAEFSDRPERWGQFIGNERRMIQTRDTVQGGSPTQRNKVDDDAFQAQTTIADAFNKWKQSGSLASLGMTAVTRALEKVFGMRNDVAVSVARQLFVADPTARARILLNIERRMTPGAMAEFARSVRQASLIVPSVAARQAPQAEK